MSLVSSRGLSILILTGSLGDGHRQAAHALAEAAHRLYPDARVQVVDVMEDIPPVLHRLSQALYLFWITKFSWLYGFLFRQTQNNTFLSRCLNRLPLCSLKRLRQILEETAPTVVISTYPAASAALAKLKRSQPSRLQTVTVITDHTYHSYWLHKGTSRYIVSSEHVRQALLRWPIADRHISVTGIPVRPAFGQPQPDRQALRLKLGLHPKLATIMIMGGGGGLIGGDWARLLRSRDLLAKPIQVIIVCGRNEKLKERLARELKDYPHPLLLTGYVDYVHELMAASDLLITKPGGLTSSEALASELPMLLYKPLPGQEHDNASFLVGTGAAVRARNEEEFVRQLSGLLEEPVLLPRMRACARHYSRKQAAEQAVREIIEWKNPAIAETSPLLQARYAKA